MVYGYTSESYEVADYNEQEEQKQLRLQALRKAIREQRILLEATEEEEKESSSHWQSIDTLKERIHSVCHQLNEEQQARSTTRGYDTKQLWSRYQTNVRQLQDLAQQRKTLAKEMDYLINVSIKDLKRRLVEETDRWSQTLIDYNKSHLSSPSYAAPLATLDVSDATLSESDRIRAKAQAMVAARLNRSRSHAQLFDHAQRVERDRQAIHEQINTIDAQLSSIQQDVNAILQQNLKAVDADIVVSEHELRQKQMFEKGMFVSDELSDFIDSLSTSNSKLTTTSKSNNSSYSYFSSAPTTNRRASYRRSLLTPLSGPLLENEQPPPIPVSQRPDSPRSSADIKAEAHRRIEQRKRMLVSRQQEQQDQDNSSRKSSSTPTQAPILNTNRSLVVDNDEKAAQVRLREAEAEARQRLLMMREKRDQARQEAAAAEKKRKQAAMEAARKAEAEMAEEKRRLQQEEEARKEKARQEAELLAERQRKLDEEARLERQRQEAEEQAREKMEDEARQRKARLAAQQAALEKRRLRQEQESREREARLTMEAEERERRQVWENMELEEQKRQQVSVPTVVLQQAESLSTPTSSSPLTPSSTSTLPVISSPLPNHSEATAGTSGYGIDVDDEVDFSSTFRAKALYAYHGIREDDLTFVEDEIIKAHPSKDKDSDWWYGSSLWTSAVGFFPRTFVEIIEKAFHVQTLYEYHKTQEGDLQFGENEILLVQPFQDENGEWWYGTNEETGESGYFPKTYVEVLDTDIPASTIPTEPITAEITKSPSTTWQRMSPSSSNSLAIPDNETARGLSAPSTPVMKKTSLDVSKQDVSRRRRAASNASSISTSMIGTPGLQTSQKRASDVPIVTTWASTMDDIELQSIPPEERSRQEAIFELISTERSYLRDLQMIVNLFYTDSGKYLQPTEQDVVFSNIDDLLLCNTAFFSDLETRQRECANVVDCIGDIFLQHAESLKCYSTFCRNQSFASRLLQKKREEDQWFDVFLKTAQTRPECRSLDLSHFLLQPVQRITRYPLLLRQVLKNTPKRHPDYGLVKSALSKASKVLEDVNEETRRFENHQKIGELGRIVDMEGFGRLDIRGREFVMEGVLYKAKSGRKLQGYLFNDLFLLVEPLKSLSSKGYLYSLYREPMNIERLVIRDQSMAAAKPAFGGATTDDTGFQIAYNNLVISVKAASMSQKRQWINQIQHYSAIRTTMH